MSIDWKTTLPGMVAALAAILKIFGVNMGKDVQDGLVLVLLFVLGLFATSRGIR